MFKILRGLFAAALFIGVPLAAQDAKPDAKKDVPDVKDAAKPDDKKAPAKDEKKAPPKHYLAAGTIVGKVAEVDTSKMTIEIEGMSRGRGYRMEKQEYTISDDAKIRTLNLPERLNDKNKPIPYTSQEKAKLKGDHKLPGYTSELSAVKRGQRVELTLSRNKPAPGTSRKKAEEEKPFVTMLVIAAEEPKMAETKKK